MKEKIKSKKQLIEEIIGQGIIEATVTVTTMQSRVVKLNI